jgi:hypothetical protein
MAWKWTPTPCVYYDIFASKILQTLLALRLSTIAWGGESSSSTESRAPQATHAGICRISTWKPWKIRSLNTILCRGILVCIMQLLSFLKKEKCTPHQPFCTSANCNLAYPTSRIAVSIMSSTKKKTETKKTSVELFCWSIHLLANN